MGSDQGRWHPVPGVYPLFSPWLFVGQATTPAFAGAFQLVLAASDGQGAGIDGLQLLPNTGWDKMLAPHWQIGEAGIARLAAFIDHDVLGYREGVTFQPAECVAAVTASALGCHQTRCGMPSKTGWMLVRSIKKMAIIFFLNWLA